MPYCKASEFLQACASSSYSLPRAFRDCYCVVGDCGDEVRDCFGLQDKRSGDEESRIGAPALGLVQFYQGQVEL